MMRKKTSALSVPRTPKLIPYSLFQSPSPNKEKILTPSSHKSFSKINRVQEPLDSLFESKINTRIKRFHEQLTKNTYLERSLQQKLEEWENIKNKLLEDFQLRIDLKSKSRKINKKEILRDSDEEDFSYSYLSKIGKLRKLNSKLIKVSKHPNLYKLNSTSLVKQIDYQSPKKSYSKFKANMSEAFQLKLSLEQKRVNFKEIEEGQNIELSSSLPLGGEMLIKVNDFKF